MKDGFDGRWRSSTSTDGESAATLPTCADTPAKHGGEGSAAKEGSSKVNFL